MTRKATDVKAAEVQAYVLSTAASLIDSLDGEEMWMSEFDGLDEDEAEKLRSRVVVERDKLCNKLRKQAAVLKAKVNQQ